MSVNVGKLRIGEVHTLLRKDYPDIELSKIRYYEDKGLVMPARSPKGYRLYSDRDVACLREAIRLAQEEFVPLRVVRVRLIEQGLLDDEGMSPTARHAARDAVSNVVSIPAPSGPATTRPNLSVLQGASTPSANDEPQQSLGSSLYLTLNEFLKTTGLDEDHVVQLQSMGLVTPAIVANEVVFTNLDSGGLPHTAALLGDATKKRANWPKSFTGGTTASKAGTDISTTGFTTGTISAGSTSATYVANVPGFYMFGCLFHYVSHGMRTVIIVK